MLASPGEKGFAKHENQKMRRSGQGVESNCTAGWGLATPFDSVNSEGITGCENLRLRALHLLTSLFPASSLLCLYRTTLYRYYNSKVRLLSFTQMQLNR